MVVDVLQNNDYVNHVISPILDDCRQLITRFQQIHIKHCYRWANWCANLMARLGVDQELDYILFTSPPVDLAKVVEDDCNGVCFNRICIELE